MARLNAPPRHMQKESARARASRFQYGIICGMSIWKRISYITAICGVAAILAAAAPALRAAEMKIDAAALEKARGTLAKMSLEEKLALASPWSWEKPELPAAMNSGILKNWKFHAYPGSPEDGAESEATLLPSPAAIAATWNTALAAAAGDVIGAEARALDCDMVMAPSIELAEDPRCIANEWRFGEDPVLVSRMASAFVRELQRHDMAACAGAGEIGAHPVSKRALHELYIKPLRAVVRDGGAMGATRPRLPRQASGEGKGGAARYSARLEDYVFYGFRISTGFDGMLVEEPAEKEEEALAAAAGTRDALAAAGSSLDERVLRIIYTMEQLKFFEPWARSKGEPPAKAHATNALAIAREAITLLKNDAGALPLDKAAVSNILFVAAASAPREASLALEGLRRNFESSHVKISQREFPGDERSHGALFFAIEEAPAQEGRESAPPPQNAQQAAAASAAAAPGGEETAGGGVWQAEWFDNVKEPQEIAWATRRVASPGFAPGAPAPLEGMNQTAFCVRWTARLKAPEKGEYVFRCRLGDGGAAAIFIDGTSLASGTQGGVIECKTPLNEGEVYEIAIVYSGGQHAHQMRFDWFTPSERAALDAIRDAAAAADAVVVFTGRAAGNRRGAFYPDMRLDAFHDLATEEILSWDAPRTIVVNASASAVSLPWIARCKTLLQMPHLGDHAGDALAGILFGDSSPCGKLPFSWPASESDIAAPTADCALDIGYRWLDRKGVAPLFPFGFGLSYTKFQIDMDKAEIAKFQEDDSWSISLPVKNTGTRPGKEVVQIYAAYPDAKVARPVKELKAFAKTRTLAPGEQETLTMKIRPRDLAYWDDFLCRFRLDAGDYQLVVASSAADIHGKAKVAVAKDSVFED